MSDLLIERPSTTSLVLSALYEIFQIARDLVSTGLASLIRFIDNPLIWDKVKFIPFLTSIHSFLRCIIKAFRREWKEAGTHLFWCIATAIGTVLFIYICVNCTVPFVLLSSGIETILGAASEFLIEYTSNESSYKLHYNLLDKYLNNNVTSRS